jgi:hypothetical protein
MNTTDLTSHVTMREAADQLGYPYHCVRYWVANKILPSIKLSPRFILIPVWALKDFVPPARGQASPNYGTRSSY